MRRALVLSGGGMFGAWQAGAWAALAGRIQFDLVVGVSVGALNGYAIACGATPQLLRELWLDPSFTQLSHVPQTVEKLMGRAHPVVEFALAVTDTFRMRPRVFAGSQVTAKHLVASCAIPLVMPQVWIDGRMYSDGGLLNPLPVWAAVELGATHILGLNALPETPSAWLRPLAKAFRAVAGYRPPVPPGISVSVLRPERTLGTMQEALRWDRLCIERWLAQGEADVNAKQLTQKTFPF